MSIHSSQLIDAGIVMMFVGVSGLITWTVLHGGWIVYTMALLTLIGFAIYFIGLGVEAQEDTLDTLSKEERLEMANEMMDETDPVELDLDDGDIERLDESTLVERTGDDICIYHVMNKHGDNNE